MAGVDESVSGTAAGDHGPGRAPPAARVHHRDPGSTDQGKFKLIQLGGMLLARAHALGT